MGLSLVQTPYKVFNFGFKYKKYLQISLDFDPYKDSFIFQLFLFLYKGP